MTKTTEEKIAVMQAFVDGKTIKFFELNEMGVVDGEATPLQIQSKNPQWNWELFDYRIAEPTTELTLEAWIDPSGELHYLRNCKYASLRNTVNWIRVPELDIKAEIDK